MKEEAARSFRLVLLAGSTGPLGNVHADHARLTMFKPNVGVADVCLSSADRLDLRPRQHHTRLKAVKNLVFVGGLPV